MARITVEDCLKKIPNRFQMTLAATYRARQLANGATPHVEADLDKPTVIIRQAVYSAAWATLCAAHKCSSARTARHPADKAETKDEEEQCRSSHKLNHAPLE